MKYKYFITYLFVSKDKGKRLTGWGCGNCFREYDHMLLNEDHIRGIEKELESLEKHKRDEIIISNFVLVDKLKDISAVDYADLLGCLELIMNIVYEHDISDSDRELVEHFNMSIDKILTDLRDKCSNKR